MIIAQILLDPSSVARIKIHAIILSTLKCLSDDKLIQASVMLLQDVKKVPLNPAMPKILCLSCAYNDTFVCSRVDKPGQEQSIVHFDSSGKILWEYRYKDIINSFAMLNEKEIIVLNVPESKIDIINLQTHKFISVNHDYLFDDVAQMTIQTFYDTRLFLVLEKGGFNDHRLRLSYYSYDGINPDSQPVALWQSKDNEWTYDHFLKKGNNHSKMIWWLYKHDHSITFTYFDLRDDPEGKMETVTAVNTLGLDYGINNLSVSIGAIWQTTPNKYMLVTISSKNQAKAKNNHGVINNNFILDATAGNDKGTLREVKFDFGLEADGFSFNDQIIDFYRLGSVSVFHTFRHDKGQILETPVYYVNNETQEIVAKETWKCSCYASNFFFPGWDPSLIVQAQYMNGDVEEVTVTVKKVMDPKEISLHFLLHLNEDFDDDLLQDAIDLLN